MIFALVLSWFTTNAGRKETTKAKAAAVSEATTTQQLAYPLQKVSHPDPNAKPQVV